MEGNVLLEKWGKIVDSEKAPKVQNREAMAQLLENQEAYNLNEASNAADMGQYTPILVPAVRRIFPNLLANEIVGVQPMSMPTGYAYALRYAYDAASVASNTTDRGGYGGSNLRAGTVIGPSKTAIAILASATASAVGDTVATVGGGGNAVIRYKDTAGTTVLLEFGTNALCQTFVDSGSSVETRTVSFKSNNEAAFNTILPNWTGPVTTAVGEAGPTASMRMSLERIAIEAMTRRLKAEYSIELAQDLKAVHGLDAEAELINILEYEISAEIDRELINRINNVAKGCATWSYSGAYAGAAYGVPVTGANIADGRWEQERFRTLYTRIIKEANAVAITSRRGTANFIIASSNVISALESLSNFMYSGVPGDVKPTLGVAKVGTLDGRFSVYLDTFATADYVTVGYKGASQFDTGVIYCPYIPLLLQKVTDPTSFQPKIAFMTRDAISENLFGASNYYRKFTVDFNGSSLGASFNYNAYSGIYAG
jgi:hypothetical protein